MDISNELTKLYKHWNVYVRMLVLTQVDLIKFLA